MSTDHRIATAVHELVREGFVHTFGQPATPAPPSETWRAVRNTGTRLWLDTGDLDEAGRLWNSEFEALTTNNTLLNKEVQKGIYDDLVRQAAVAIRKAVPAVTDEQLVLEIGFVLNARHGLALVKRFDAFVSVELHTALGNDVARTAAYGRRFYAICPERFYVKVPLSPAGLLGARHLADAGIPVNFTLGFSARQNVLAALLARPAFVNVFMGRLNAFVADNALGDGNNMGEKATLATQREILALRQADRTEAHLIGASMRNGAQVGTLSGLDVFTMPTKVAAEYQKAPRPNLTSHVSDDPEVLTAQGVSLADFAGESLWSVSPDFHQCVDELVGQDVATLTPEAVVTHLERGGFGDLFPRWSSDDIAAVQRDGKIPVFDVWQERLAAGRVGLDALMNLSAFYSFTSDQGALDTRIRKLLG